jgi:hypothetical protein
MNWARSPKCAMRAAVVAALEGEHQALAAARIAHELERVLDGLCAADVEVNASRAPPLFLSILRDPLRELDLGRMEILAGDLRQRFDLLQEDGLQPFVLVTEVHGRIPHLQVEIRCLIGIEHVAPVAPGEDLGGIHVVNGVAERAVPRFIDQQLISHRHVLSSRIRKPDGRRMEQGRLDRFAPFSGSPIVAAVATLTFRRVGESSHQARLKTNATLVPPNANELLIA